MKGIFISLWSSTPQGCYNIGGECVQCTHLSQTLRGRFLNPMIAFSKILHTWFIQISVYSSSLIFFFKVFVVCSKNSGCFSTFGTHKFLGHHFLISPAWFIWEMLSLYLQPKHFFSIDKQSYSWFSNEVTIKVWACKHKRNQETRNIKKFEEKNSTFCHIDICIICHLEHSDGHSQLIYTDLRKWL